jgi:SOS-response transcriptional repressor LexA
MQQKNERKLTFSKKLERLLKEKGIRAAELARALGLSHVAIGNYIKAESLPDGSVLYDIAKYFNVSMEELLAEHIPPKEEVAKPRNWGGPYWGTTDGCPIVSWASAGDAHAYEDQGAAARVIRTNCDDPNCYALELEGDSMEPIYKEGDVIVMAPNYEANRGDLVMLKTADDDVYFKKWIPDKWNKLRFQSLNPDYPVIILEPREISKIHPVWSVVRFFKGKKF